MFSLQSLVQASISKLPFRIQRPNETKLRYSNKFWLVSEKGSRIRHTSLDARRINCSASGRNYRELRFEDESSSDPFWLSPIKESFWALRSLLVFLVEQPSQLKYIEWPTFQSTISQGHVKQSSPPIVVVNLTSMAAEDCYSYSCTCSLAHCCALLY
ncbi:uncharacterized protein LOC143877839 isoform X2 [Tasmannia lanceolata]|uniref:uncharacterized protein LOC143877839 isoform X2 n=1 Tax=Tasmannia lanceolata TaxID=3420 RepID=UPI004064A8C9